MKRPTETQYNEAFDLYRAGLEADEIADRTGLKVEQVERAATEGWPDRGGRSGLASFESILADRERAVRLDQLDWMHEVARGAVESARSRVKSAKTAAELERVILQAWAAQCSAAVANAGGKPPKVEDLLVNLDAVRSLRALRIAQDPTPELRVAELFQRFNTAAEDEAEETDGWIQDLAALPPEEQAKWAEQGGPVPKAQQVLPFKRSG